MEAFEKIPHKFELEEGKDPSASNNTNNEDVEGLTKEGKESLDNRTTTSKQLAAEAKEYLKRANESLQKLAREEQVLSFSDHNRFLKKITEVEESPDTESSTKAKKLCEEIEEYKANKLKKTTEEELVREVNDPEIETRLNRVKTLFEDPETAKHIGTNQVEAFKAWCVERIKKNPTIKNAEETIYLVQNHSTDGIKPRKEFYETQIKPLLSRYGMTIGESPLLREKGFSERKSILPLMKQSSELIEEGFRAGFYSIKTKQKIVADMLKSPESATIWRKAGEIKQIRQKEDNNYALFERKITINGTEIDAMSKASKKELFKSYADYDDLSLRKTTVDNWKQIIENEANLAREFGEIYKDDKEGFRNAIHSFNLMDYTQKERAIKEHKKLKEENEKGKLQKSLEILKKSLTEIEKAENEKVLCTKTAKRFRDFVLDKSRYTDSKGKLDIEKQQKLHEGLTSKTPVHEKEKRNIEAYRQKRNLFRVSLKKFGDITPEMTNEKLEEKQAQYDAESYTKRMELHEKLKGEIAKKEKEKEKMKKLRSNSTEMEKVPDIQKGILEKRFKLLRSLDALIEEKTPESVREGLNQIYSYMDAANKLIEDFSGDPEIEKRLSELLELKRALGNPEEAKKTEEEEMMEEAKKTMEENKFGVGDRVRKQEKIHKASTLISLSEKRHGEKKKAADRALEAALEKSEDETQKRIIEDYHKRGGVINKKDTGGKVRKIEADEEKLGADWISAKDHVDAEGVDNLEDKAGTTEIEITKDGQVLDKEGRKRELEQREEAIAVDVGEQMNEQREKKEGIKKPSAYSKTALEVARKRAARRVIEEKVKKAA